MAKLTIYLCALQLAAIYSTNLPLPIFGSSIALVGVLLCMAWGINLIFSQSVRRVHLVHILILCFFAWSSLTFLWSEDRAATFAYSISYIRYFILIYIFWDIIDTHEKLILCMKGSIVGASFAILSQLFSYAIGSDIGGGRYSAADFDPNYYGVLLATAIPIAWYLSIVAKSRLMIMFYILFIPMAIVGGGILSGSRTGFLLTSLASLYPVWTFISRSRNVRDLVLSKFKVALICMLLLIATGGFVQLISMGAFDRIATLWDGSANTTSLGNRTYLWGDALERISENFFGGIGAGSFKSTSYIASEELRAHNTYLSVLVETGSIGFMFLILILSIVYWKAYQERDRAYRACWATMLSVLYIGIFTLTWEARPYMWLIMTMPLINSSNQTEQNQSNVAEEYSDV